MTMRDFDAEIQALVRKKQLIEIEQEISKIEQERRAVPSARRSSAVPVHGFQPIDQKPNKTKQENRAAASVGEHPSILASVSQPIDLDPSEGDFTFFTNLPHGLPVPIQIPAKVPVQLYDCPRSATTADDLRVNGGLQELRNRATPPNQAYKMAASPATTHITGPDRTGPRKKLQKRTAERSSRQMENKTDRYASVNTDPAWASIVKLGDGIYVELCCCFCKGNASARSNAKLHYFDGASGLQRHISRCHGDRLTSPFTLQKVIDRCVKRKLTKKQMKAVDDGDHHAYIVAMHRAARVPKTTAQKAKVRIPEATNEDNSESEDEEGQKHKPAMLRLPIPSQDPANHTSAIGGSELGARFQAGQIGNLPNRSQST